MNCSIPNDARDEPLITHDLDSPPPPSCRVTSTHPVEVEKTIISDVFDHVANLIRVSLQHHYIFGGPLQGRPSRAIGITLYRI